MPTEISSSSVTSPGRSAATRCSLRAAHDVFDHRRQTHVHAVVRVIDAFDAVDLQFGDFLRRDRAAAAAENADVSRAAFLEHVDHVLEVFDMAALIRRQRDAIRIFLQRGAHDVFDAAVVAEMHNFCALRLDQPAHDVDGGVVPVEQAGGGDETQRRGFCRRLLDGEILGGGAHGCRRGLARPPLYARRRFYPKLLGIFLRIVRRIDLSHRSTFSNQCCA